jgi:hypothetical protein
MSVSIFGDGEYHFVKLGHSQKFGVIATCLYKTGESGPHHACPHFFRLLQKLTMRQHLFGRQSSAPKPSSPSSAPGTPQKMVPTATNPHGQELWNENTNTKEPSSCSLQEEQSSADDDGQQNITSEPSFEVLNLTPDIWFSENSIECVLNGF